jgi:hypothetical protein
MIQTLKTLNDLFNIENNEEIDSNFSKVESSENLASIKADKKLFIKGIEWEILRKEILKKIIDLLDVDVVKIIVNSWIDKDFFEQINKIKDAAPDETIIVPLVEHTVESTHNPYIVIMYNGEVVHKINFEIKVDFHLRAIILSFQNKKLKEISSGECDITGELLCENIKVLDAELKNIKLPLVLNLRDGIPISKN